MYVFITKLEYVVFLRRIADEVSGPPAAHIGDGRENLFRAFFCRQDYGEILRFRNRIFFHFFPGNLLSCPYKRFETGENSCPAVAVRVEFYLAGNLFVDNGDPRAVIFSRELYRDQSIAVLCHK